MTPTPEGSITASDLWKNEQENNPPAEVIEDEPGVQVPTDDIQED